MSRRRSLPRTLTGVVILLAALGACAKKPAALPTVPGAPRFVDFVFPEGPPALAAPAVWERHRASWTVLRTKSPWPDDTICCLV